MFFSLLPNIEYAEKPISYPFSESDFVVAKNFFRRFKIRDDGFSYAVYFTKYSITDFKVNYTPDNNYATLQNSFPVAVEIDISFLETKLVFAEDVDPNIVLDLSYNKDGEYIGTTAPTGQGSGFMSSDSRLKENIVRVGNSPSGLNIYEWNYKSAPDTRYRGVMAQEVLETNPNAVYLFEDGYLGVNYGHLDVNMEMVK